MSNFDYIDRLFRELDHEIAPCPFCGWSAKLRGVGNSILIRCGGCGTESGSLFVEDPAAFRPGLMIEEACRILVDNWNKRYTGNVPIFETMEYKVQNKLWRTREGKAMKICDMTTEHIKNCMNMLGNGSEFYDIFEYELNKRKLQEESNDQ